MKELRSLSNPEVEKRLEQLKRDLLKFNVQASMGTNAAQSGKIKQTKKGIARLLTLLQEKGGSN